METRRRLLPTILVNILVSALVTGTILYFYNRANRADCATTPPMLATLPPGSGDVNINISGLFSVGVLQDERLVIQNDGSAEIELTGWQLTDNKGLDFIFPQLVLFPGASVQVHSAAGKDSPTDLYWGRSDPVWISGELVALYDTHNIARAFYRVP